jgi:hypothetical protein
MRNAWYPASKTDPDTVATFRALDLFRLLNVVGNMNARDFITALERLTDGMASTGMKWLPVSVDYHNFWDSESLMCPSGLLQGFSANGAAVGVFAEGETRGSSL